MPDWRDLVSDPRRSIGQVAGVYLVASWAVYQVALGLTEGLGLPDWVPVLTIVLIAAGLPIVIATALVQRAASRGGFRRLLTWRRSLLAGVAAFGMLVVATSGFMAMRHYGIGPVGSLLAQGVIAGDRPVVLADFAGEPALSAAVTEALRIDLVQSDVLRLEDPANLRPALERMQHDAGAGLPESVARELAQREGYRAVIAGEIATLGGAYVLTARVVRADSGIAVAAFKSVAKDSTQLIDAVEDMSRQIRGKAGESLKAVRAAPPLEQASTASLPALRKFSDALRVSDQTGDYARAASLLQEAVAIDSAFGMAWRRLGIMLLNMGVRPGETRDAFRRAYALRDRMSEIERHITTATYYQWVELDRQRVIDAYRAVLELDPKNRIATNNLPAELNRMGRPAEAERILLALPERERTGTHWLNLLRAQALLGRADSLELTLARARALLPRNAILPGAELRIALLRGDFERADSLADAALAAAGDNRAAILNLAADRAYMYVLLGRMDDVNAFMGRLAQASRAAGAGANFDFSAGVTEAAVRVRHQQPAVARDVLARTLSRHPLESIPPAEREYLAIARVYADLGEFAAARRTLDAYASHQDLADRAQLAWTRAYLALREGRAAEAVPVLRDGVDGEPCALCSLPVLAEAYEQIGDADSARAVHDRFLTHPEADRLTADAYWRAHVLERSALLHEQAGNTNRAIERYAELTRMWRRADPALQPRVRAAGERVNALRGGG